MAGTDRSVAAAVGGPAVILVDPQMGENIGATARAMYNFGLVDLRIVRPRDGWPNSRAIANASGATPVIERARTFDDVPAAIADLHHVYAATARPRDMVKQVLTPRGAAEQIRENEKRELSSGILLGGERAGLSNDDLVLAKSIITIPTNPSFASLNLAQAALLIAYEWFSTADETPHAFVSDFETRPANGHEMNGLFEHLERELSASGFLHPPEKTPTMVRNIRNMLHRANLTEQDVRTLRGMIASLAQGRNTEPK